MRAAVMLGIVDFRLTGGGPLVQRDIVYIVQTIAAIPGVRDLAMTTIAFRLAALAQPLRDAGLHRINISLDSLRRKCFAQIVKADAYDRVWAGVQAAEEVEFDPLKLNVVALRGINDDEIHDFARLTLEHAWHIRFIELMPVGDNIAAPDFFEQHFRSTGEIQARLVELIPVESPRGSGPAKTFRLAKAHGTVGFIAPESEHFCAECNHIRVTARGEILAYLFGKRAGEGNIVRAETSESRIREIVRRAIRNKPEYRAFGDAFRITAQTMAEIG